MSRLTKFAVLTVLALWGLAMMHCKLESLPTFAFLKTCCFAESGDPAPAAEHCDTDGCDSIEKGGYRMEEQTAPVRPPSQLLTLLLITATAGQLEPTLEADRRPPSFPPPDQPKSWQFLLRTALPPRAPSFIA